MKKILFFLIFCATSAHAQDTISTYFDFGKSKLKSSYKHLLLSIPSIYDLSEVDSISFIGYADSVGKTKANIRLSEKRAKTVYNFCKHQFEDIAYTINPLGEGPHFIDSINRRVDLILHYAPPDVVVNDISVNEDPNCFFVDIDALKYCNIRTIQKKRKEYVQIESLIHPHFKEVQLYYRSNKSSGASQYHRVRWKRTKTGRLWWKKERYVSTIPKDSYEKFRFFTLKEPPCDGCKEDLLALDTVILTITENMPDLFLMNNLQSRARIFAIDKYRIRVPREYVDLTDTYYLNYSAMNDLPSIEWFTRKRKRFSDYYFADIEVRNNNLPYISKNYKSTICRNVWDAPVYYGLGCRQFGFRLGYHLSLESGLLRSNDSLLGFVGTGFIHSSNRTYTSAIAGINTNRGFYGSLRFSYYVMSIPLTKTFGNAQWSEPSQQRIYSYSRVYLGTELRNSFNQSDVAFLEGNLHLGLTYTNTSFSRWYPMFYLHGGIANDFLNQISTRSYLFIQVGLSINIHGKIRIN